MDKAIMTLLAALPLLAGAAQEYEATQASLVNYQAPEWYQDAKFGVWAHWGVYSVPAFGGTHAAEWYPRHMYDASNANWHCGPFMTRHPSTMPCAPSENCTSAPT